MPSHRVREVEVERAGWPDRGQLEDDPGQPLARMLNIDSVADFAAAAGILAFER
ncbi:hypothetical protein MINTM020_02310 [Mycobacterium paraintracellulare]|nr:hypothetical protein MINTM020_02310 [Mycobacterium paraintracellulare]